MTAHEGDNPETIVRTFLAAIERRDLDTGRRFVTSRTAYTFPGGHKPSSLEGVVERSAARYSKVAKKIDQVDVLAGDGGTSVVYCFGTLYGQWSNGAAFEGIRFIDRFELRNGKILRQDVWNDTAHHPPA